jgi:hypothetical protein
VPQDHLRQPIEPCRLACSSARASHAFPECRRKVCHNTSQCAMLHRRTTHSDVNDRERPSKPVQLNRGPAETREDFERVTDVIKKDATTDTCRPGVAVHSMPQMSRRRCPRRTVIQRSLPLQNNSKDRLQEIMLIEISHRNSSVILFLS